MASRRKRKMRYGGKFRQNSDLAPKIDVPEIKKEKFETPKINRPKFQHTTAEKKTQKLLLG